MDKLDLKPNHDYAQILFKQLVDLSGQVTDARNRLASLEDQKTDVRNRLVGLMQVYRDADAAKRKALNWTEDQLSDSDMYQMFFGMEGASAPMDTANTPPTMADFRSVLLDLVRLQLFYARRAFSPGSMPGNDFYSDKLVTIVNKARQCLRLPPIGNQEHFLDIPSE